jgi:hypothetical protein
VTVGEEVMLHAVPDLGPLRLTSDSADRLITGAGTVRARLAGAPTYFVSSLQLLRLGDPLAKPLPLPFAAGPAGDWLEFEINTGTLPAGPYSLMIGQQGGAKADFVLAIQTPAPALANLPIPVHQGAVQTVTFSGQGLDRIEKITSKYARIDWNPASHQAKVTLAAKAPAEIDIEAHVEGRHQPLRIASALRAMGPKPVILTVTRAPQAAGTVERFDGEIDAGQAAAFSLQVQNMGPSARVVLSCKEPGLKPGVVEAKPIGADVLYFTLAANGQSGCTLGASVNGSNLVSLGRTVSLPVIDGFTLTDEAVEAQTFKGELRGRGLEAIARTGWTAEMFRDVSAIPVPEGDGQKLEIVMPWPAPSPHAPLKIWLRGETEPRRTVAKY